MSIENHPNINAAAFTSDLVLSFNQHLRGNANKDSSTRLEAYKIIHEKLIDFVTRISIELDEKFGVE